jgi:hypothetical protein
VAKKIELRPKVNVTITVIGDFRQLLAVFFFKKKQCCDLFFTKTSFSLSKNDNFFQTGGFAACLMRTNSPGWRIWVKDQNEWKWIEMKGNGLK